MRLALFHLASKTLYLRKKSSISLIFSIAFCISFSLILVSVLNSYRQNSEKQLIKVHGIQHAIIFNAQPGYNPEPEVSDNTIIRSGLVQIHGTFEIPESITEEVVSLGSMDISAIDLSKLRLLDGKLPDFPNGVAIEKGVLARMKVTPIIGMEIPLNLNLLNEDRKSKGESVHTTFILTGILENYRANQLPDVEQRFSGFVDLPAVLLPQDNILSKKGTFTTHHYYIQYSEASNPMDLASKLKDSVSAELVFLNTNVYNPINSDMQIKSIGIDLMPPLLLVGCILFAAFFLLANIILLTGSERMKQIICLHYAGAGSRDVLQYTAINGSMLILFAIPVSILLTIPMFLLLRMILEKFPIAPFDYILDFSGAGFIILSAVMLVFILIIWPIWKLKHFTPMELSRSMVSEDSIRNVNFKSKNAVLLWAVKSAINNRNKVVMSCISFALIVVTVISGVYIIRTIKIYNLPSTLYDYWLNKTSKLYYSSLKIPEKTDYGISNEHFFYLASSPDLNEVHGIKRMDFNIARYQSDISKKYNDLNILPSLGMEELMVQDKEKFGYESDMIIHRRTLVGMDEELISALSTYVIRGSINIDRLKTGNDVILCSKKQDVWTKAGDTFELSQVINEKLFVKSINVIAVVVIPEDRTDLGNLYGSTFIWHNQAFNTLEFPVLYSDIRMALKNTGQADDIKGRLQEAIKNNTDSKSKMVLRSGIEENEKYRNIGETGRLFVSIIVIILGFFSLINVIYYYNMKIRGRIRLCGVMRAIGMTKTQLVSMELCEAGFYAGISGLIGLGMSLFVFVIFNDIPGVSFLSVIPYEYMVLTPVVLLLITLAAVMFPAINVYKQTEIEAIYDL